MKKNRKTEYSNIDEFITPERRHYNISVLIYHHQDFIRRHQMLKSYDICIYIYIYILAAFLR